MPDGNETNGTDDGTGTEAGPSCGDGLCDDGETHESCPEDCEEIVEVPGSDDGTFQGEDGIQPEPIGMLDYESFNWLKLILLAILSIVLAIVAWKKG